MRIKLLPSNAKQIAENILSGALPPETSDREVIYWLSELDPELTVYRLDKYRSNGELIADPKPIEFDAKKIKIALEHSIEMRPIQR